MRTLCLQHVPPRARPLLVDHDRDAFSYRGYSPSGEQFVYCVEIEVLKVNDETLLYGKIENSDQNKRIECPEPISFTCKQLRGDFSWRNVRVETNSPLVWFPTFP